MTNQKNFYVCVVKQNLYMPDITLLALMNTSLLRGLNFKYINSMGSVLTTNRSRTFEILKHEIINNKEDLKNTYALFIDSDIVIQNTPYELKEIFENAEKKKINIAGHYKKSDFTSTFLKKGTNDQNPQYITALDEFNDTTKRYINLSNYYFGLGFFYGKIQNYDYVFKMMDRKGEDVIFLEENKKLWKNTYLDKNIKLFHYKTILI